jgi:hypothetical protein
MPFIVAGSKEPSNGESVTVHGNPVGPGAVTTAGQVATAVETAAPTTVRDSREYISVGPTSFLVSAVQSGGSDIVIGDGYATLAPGTIVTINGVPISYEVSGSITALIVGGSTVPVGVTTTAAVGVGKNATSTTMESYAGSLKDPVCLIAFVFGVVGALIIAL